jgi:hypothetical protein
MRSPRHYFTSLNYILTIPSNMVMSRNGRTGRFQAFIGIWNTKGGNGCGNYGTNIRCCSMEISGMLINGFAA